MPEFVEWDRVFLVSWFLLSLILGQGHGHFHGRGVTDDASRFEAFDEPWKIMLNSPGREWEDKWGLMDTARNLKPGLKIPDCGGKTV